MKKVKLTQGKYALVDDSDFDKVSRYNWCAVNIKGTWYACRRPNKVNKYSRMHRFILSAKDNQEIDHINRDGLDNRRSNIWVCSRSQNLKNRKTYGLSKVKGVTYHTRDKVWQAYKKIKGKQIHIGNFNREYDAIKAIGRQT